MGRLPNVFTPLLLILVLISPLVKFEESENTIFEDSSIVKSIGATNSKIFGFTEGGNGETKFSLHNERICWINRQSSQVYCVTSNQFDQFADDQSDIGDYILPLPSGMGVPEQVSIADNYICIIDHRGRIFCNHYSEENKSDWNENRSHSFHEIHATGTPFSSVRVGESNSCALSDYGSVWCWTNLELNGKSRYPINVIDGGETSAISISAGENGFCAITIERDVLCWNQNREHSFNVSKPIFPSSISAAALAIGENYVCALRMDHNVSCKGNIGVSLDIPSSMEEGISNFNSSSLSPIVISSVKEHLCLANEAGSVYCIGKNSPLEDLGFPIFPALSISEGISCFISKLNYILMCMVNSESEEPELISLGVTLLSSFDSDDDGILDHFDDFPYDKGKSLICPLGFSGRHSCLPSPKGAFVNQSGSTEYLLCMPGSFQDDLASTSCKLSPPGSFNSESGAILPEFCPAGSFSISVGSSGRETCLLVSPGNWSLPGSLSQTLCPVGKFQTLSGQGSCEPSSPGYFVGLSGQTSQEECDIGTFQNNSNSDNCIIAEMGNYVDSRGSPSQTPCPSGTYNPDSGATSLDSCLPSPPGTFVQENASYTFELCPSGSFNPLEYGQSLDDCQATSPGHFSTSGSASQIPCLPGEFQPDYSQGSCITAEVGYFTPLPGSEKQVICPPGTFQNISGQSSCIESNPGEFVDPANPVKPISCPEGSFQPNFRQIECASSLPGFYVDYSNPISQIPCPIGFFQPEPSSNSCIASLPGQYVPNLGSSMVYTCQPGTFQPHPSQDNCKPATLGNYSSETGSSNQTPCPVGYFQNQTNSTSCIPSEPGFFVPSISSSLQIECPLGYYQENYSQQQCTPSQEGFFVDELAASSPKMCPDGGTNYGLSNVNYWSCEGSDYDGDGIPDYDDVYPYMAADINPVKMTIYWIPFPMAIAFWIKNRSNSGTEKIGGV